MKEYYTLLQKRVIIQLKKIQGLEVRDEIAQVDDKILDMYSPKSFQGKTSLEVRMIKNFEESVVFLSQHMSRDPKTMTVLEFYQALEIVTGQNKKQKKLNGQPN